MSVLYHVLRFIFYPILRLLFPYRVFGREKFPENGRCILCANHISYFDPIYLILAQKKRFPFFMAKDSLFHHFILGWFLRKMGAFPVKKGVGSAEAMKTAYDLLEKNKVLGIFPEGTRSRNGQLLRAKPGVALLAHQTDSPIVPVALLCKNARVRPFRMTHVVYCDPILPGELGITGNSLRDCRAAAERIMEPIHREYEQYFGLSPEEADAHE